MLPKSSNNTANKCDDVHHMLEQDGVQLSDSIQDRIFQPLYQVTEYLSYSERAQLYQAYIYAFNAHSGQIRNSGEPYITHPVAVACVCANWKLDVNSLIASILHDVVEDCNVSITQIKQDFGNLIGEIVDGLTKLEKIKFTSREENMAESFRKLLLAMAKDVRVILIKLADRTHNMRTLSSAPATKWARIAQETLDIYVPIAYRLGVNAVYRELRQLSFKYLIPWRFEIIEKATKAALNRYEYLINQVMLDIKAICKKANIQISVARKEKELYSIYRKMKDKRLPFSKVNDLCGFLVIVPNIVDCYTTLGLLHQKFKPIPGKFKDHIAIPKVNGYQSLHTSLMISKTVAADFQIQTPMMHQVAESGIVTNWIERINRPISEKVEQMDTKWLQSLIDIQKESDNAADFWEHIKEDLFPDSVYVFTPKGRIFALPYDSTPVDFAYAVHSDIGDHAIAAKINNEQAPLRTKLRNGDSVEIITSPNANPNPNWLSFVKTGRARSRIKSFIRNIEKLEAIQLGQQLLQQYLKAEGFSQLPEQQNKQLQTSIMQIIQNNNCKNFDELISNIGSGKVVALIVAKDIANALNNAGYKPDLILLSATKFNEQDIADSTLVLDGDSNSFLNYANCCRPIPGDKIIGYINKGNGLIIHRTKCSKIQAFLSTDHEQFVNVSWSEDLIRNFEAVIDITVTNAQGILAAITTAITNEKADIIDFSMEPKRNRDTVDLRFTILVKNTAHLQHIIKRLATIQNIINAKRG